MFEITVNLLGAGEVVDTYHTFNIEVKPPVGSILVIERTTPAALSPVMILN
jgi:archaellin